MIRVAYPEITNEQFDKRLKEKFEENKEDLLEINGIYDVLVSYFEDEILEEYEEENEHYLTFDQVLKQYLDGRTIKEMRKEYNYDDIMLREDFNNYTDMLCKDGEISEWAYENWDNPF